MIKCRRAATERSPSRAEFSVNLPWGLNLEDGYRQLSNLAVAALRGLEHRCSTLRFSTSVESSLSRPSRPGSTTAGNLIRLTVAANPCPGLESCVAAQMNGGACPVETSLRKAYPQGEVGAYYNGVGSKLNGFGETADVIPLFANI